MGESPIVENHVYFVTKLLFQRFRRTQIKTFSRVRRGGGGGWRSLTPSPPIPCFLSSQKCLYPPLVCRFQKWLNRVSPVILLRELVTAWSMQFLHLFQKSLGPLQDFSNIIKLSCQILYFLGPHMGFSWYFWYLFFNSLTSCLKFLHFLLNHFFFFYLLISREFWSRLILVCFWLNTLFTVWKKRQLQLQFCSGLIIHFNIIIEVLAAKWLVYGRCTKVAGLQQFLSQRQWNRTGSFQIQLNGLPHIGNQLPSSPVKIAC